jgi:hypothetical protein
MLCLESWACSENRSPQLSTPRALPRSDSTPRRRSGSVRHHARPRIIPSALSRGSSSPACPQSRNGCRKGRSGFTKSSTTAIAMIVWRDGDRVRLFTRRGYDWTHRFGWIVHSLQALRVQSVSLDGEMVVCDDSRRCHLSARMQTRVGGDRLQASRFPYRSGRGKAWIKPKNPTSPAMMRIEDGILYQSLHAPGRASPKSRPY